MNKSYWNRMAGVGALLLAILLASPALALAQNTIKITMEAGNSFTVDAVRGTNITVSGANETATFPISTGTTFTPTAGNVITFSGDVTGIRFVAGTIKAIEVSSSHSTLAQFISERTTLGSVNLAGATQLTTLRLQDYSLLKTLDLSKLSLLKTVTLGRYGEDAKQRSLTTVAWPTTNVVETLALYETTIDKVDFTKFAKLKKLDIRGTGFGALNQDLVFKSQPIESIILFRVGHLQNLTLENCTALTTLQFSGSRDDLTTPITIAVTGCTALTTVDLAQGSGWGAPKNIQTINLSGNALTSVVATIGGASLFSAPNLKRVDISNNKIPSAAIDKIIAWLPQGKGDGTYIFSGAITSGEGNQFTEAHKTALAAKGWSTSWALSVDPIQASQVRIFPSETTDMVYIEGIGQIAPVKVYSLSGVLVKEAATSELGSGQVSLGDLPSGIYLITVGSNIRQRVMVR